MSKGSGGTHNSTWRDNQSGKMLSAYDFHNSKYVNLPTQIGGSAVKELAERMGSNPKDIEEAFNLIQEHSNGYGSSEDQAAVDEKIYQIINDPKNKIGKALRNISKINEAHYDSWRKFQETRIKDAKSAPIDKFGEEAIQYYTLTDPDYGGMSHKEAMAEIISDRVRSIHTDIKIYRGGNNKNAEAWTTDIKGADVGNGVRIKPTQSSSLNEKRKTHYILGGISQMVGASGESEIFLVKRKK